MVEIRCRVCGEKWTEDQICHEMTAKERETFQNGLHCPKCKKTAVVENEITRAVHSIIDTLNEIEQKVRNLETMLQNSQNPFSAQQQADGIVNDFFFFCQVIEDQIKLAYGAEYIGPDQAAALNMQLSQAVQKMDHLAEMSEKLSNALVSYQPVISLFRTRSI